MPARPLPLRLLDAVLYSSAWLAGAAAAQTAATLHQWPAAGARGGRAVALVFAATLLVYNLDAVLPFKHREPAGASGRKAWQQRHRRALAGLAGAAALGGGYLFLADGWWRYLPLLLPLAALALLYSWPLGRWGGRPRALREVPLLKVFLIAGVWAAITVGLPVLALHRPWAEAAGTLAAAAAARWGPPAAGPLAAAAGPPLRAAWAAAPPQAAGPAAPPTPRAPGRVPAAPAAQPRAVARPTITRFLVISCLLLAVSETVNY